MVLYSVGRGKSNREVTVDGENLKDIRGNCRNEELTKRLKDIERKDTYWRYRALSKEMMK